MARAAAKRGEPPKSGPRPRPPRKDRGGESVESTLFFNRIRRQAKWVFVLLALVFGLGFVVFGVGSDLGGGLGDVFSGIGGDSGKPSVDKALTKTLKNPKDAAAWRELANAYELNGKPDDAINAWSKFVALRPKSIDGHSRLAALYEGRVGEQTQRAREAAFDVQAAQATALGPPPTSPLGRALSSQPNPITQAVAQTANERYNKWIAERQTSLRSLVGAYQQLAELQPDEPSVQLQLATSAQNAGDTATAVQAYKAFLKLAPDDPNAVYAKQQIRTLESQLAPAPQG